MKKSVTKQELILQKPPKETKILLFFAILMLLIYLGFFTAIIWLPMVDGISLWQQFHEDDFPTAFFLIFFGTIAALIFFVSFMILYRGFLLLYERILVDDRGIHHISNLPTKLQKWTFINPYKLTAYQKDWSVTWSAIKAVYIRKFCIDGIPGNTSLILELDMGLERQEIFLCQWTDSENLTPTPCTPSGMRPWCVENNPEHYEWLRTLPLVQAIAKRGISIEIEKDIDLSAPFYTTFNRYSVVAALLFLAFTLFAMLNAGKSILGEIYIEFPFITANFVIAGIVALLFAIWLRHAKIPMSYSLVSGLLVGASLFTALPSATLLLNYWTDKAGLQTYHYQYQEKGIFMPIDHTLPPIELWDSNYWQTFPEGTLHEFQLRKGGLGFYQLHITDIEKTRRDYEKSN